MKETVGGKEIGRRGERNLQSLDQKFYSPAGFTGGKSDGSFDRKSLQKRKKHGPLDWDFADLSKISLGECVEMKGRGFLKT